MFCPNCGNNCGDAKFCANCGASLKAVVVTIASSNSAPDPRTEMIRRYERYMPDRLEALRVLRQDTGMNAMEAMRTIDELFPEKKDEDASEITDAVSQLPATEPDVPVINVMKSRPVHTAEWNVGMPCPNCGGTQLVGNNCAYCGAVLVLNSIGCNTDNEDDSFTLPKIYHNMGDFIDLKENCFITREYALFSKKYREYEISYSQIISIAYFRKDKKQNGVIIAYDANGIQTLEISPYKHVDVLYQLFCYLKTVVSQSAQITVDEQYLSSDVAAKWLKRFDTDVFFNTFNPHQKRARKKIEELTGLSDQESASIAAKVICERQDEMYRLNPALAIRDLNRAIVEQEREEERKWQEREEKRKERNRNYRYRR